jgi:sugar/nucleoside kinase (ribokinase family)
VVPLAVIGNLSRDVVDGGAPRVGGGPFHCARALRLLGRPARVITKCAEDDLLRPLVAQGIPVRWRRSGSTAAFSIRYRGDVREMHVDALGEPWAADETRGWVSAALNGARWVHVAPLARSDFGAEALAELARGRSLSLDGQGLVRPSRTGPLELDRDFDPAVLEHVRVLKLAEDEARVLLGDRELETLGVPEVVVTLGGRGSIVWAGGKLERIPARPAGDRVDPTGAGDAFAAVYAAARSDGRPPGPAARQATSVVSALISGGAA